MEKLKTGDKAPRFEGKDQNGNILTLEHFKGKNLVLYFYPKDNTPDCTAEACSLRDGRGELQKLGYEVVGVSPDSESSHEKFAGKNSLNFPLISDPEKTIAKSYGVWGEKRMAGRKYMGILRTTFLIGPDGIILHVIDKVRTKDHFEQILEIIK